MSEAMNKLGELKDLIKSIKERVDSMCKDICGEYGLDFEDEFNAEANSIESSIKKEDEDKSEKTDKDEIEESFKSFEVPMNESKIHCSSLYDRAKRIFETRNGICEDGSDYCFDDFVRESVAMREKSDIISESIGFFGAKSMITEADEIDKYIDEWTRNGRNMADLEITGRESDDERKMKKRMKKIIGGGISPIDRNRDGVVSQKEMTKAIDNVRDINGKIPNETLLKKGAEEIKGGITNYLSTFMPTSWARGLVNAPGKLVKKATNSAIGNKVGKAYKVLGGNKALALGTLGSLAFGPIGGAVGVGAGKLLQKAVDLGNNG